MFFSMNRNGKIIVAICAVCGSLAFHAASAVAGTPPAAQASSFGPSAASARFSVASTLAAATGNGGAAVPDTDYGKWSVPEPDERAILAGIGDDGTKKIVHYSALGVAIGGAVLCAAGLATIFAGAARDADGSMIHRGALCVISGSVTSALFAAVYGATGPRPISQE